MAAQIFNNLKKKKPSRAGGWVHIYNSNSFFRLKSGRYQQLNVILFRLIYGEAKKDY